LVKTLSGQVLRLNGFVNPYSQIKWIFSTKVARHKALVLFKLNSHAKMAPDMGVSEMSVSVQERTSAIFFWLVVMELSVQRTAATEQDIENCVAPGVPRRSNAGWLLAPLAAATPMVSSRKRYQ
jgi:hypothetical protein